ncbi:RpiB/LacA/LacB family sugar-phosphate isomerase [Gracilibacillus halophilus YIM-C55.5]|uniref:RpiB/LacA/LacB family sugar-phosphate isomerase n=1 Tax=Gracilibacillus halophilus YIM-C55.5 TaxID=1308866 RepID=N4WJ34_9BACI|nr:ribose 5-phosphate isomerase B [Gracilibacillus halophilus]ENH96152.1 RpiB/LacA/LacB family sugar-phosphate isomerase [Gracilibacillus halophilus YIM-C55.5]
MKIALGGDNNAFKLKGIIKEHLENQGFDIDDYGCHSEDAVDYPDVAYEVAQAISEEKADRGILICGTGIGVSIAANKYPGVRAALAHDVYSAERAQLSNNAQILTMGAQIVGDQVAKKVVDAYLNVEWAEGSKRKVDKIIEQEKQFVSENLQDVVTKGC